MIKLGLQRSRALECSDSFVKFSDLVGVEHELVHEP